MAQTDEDENYDDVLRADMIKLQIPDSFIPNVSYIDPDHSESL
jgi:hypothetical protein